MNHPLPPLQKNAPINQSQPIEMFETTSNDEESIDLAQYWQTIRRHKWGILSVTLIALIIGILTALSAVPIYKAETKLLADPLLPNAPMRDQYANTALVFLFYETQYEIIRSQNIAKKAVDKLDLVAKAKSEATKAKQATPSEPENIFQQIKAWRKSFNWWGLLPDEKLSQTKPVAEPTDEEIRRRIASGIQGSLSVKGGKQSQIISISYESADPKLAADVTNAIADAYVEFGLNSRLTGAKKTSSWLSEQLNNLRDKLQQSETALQSYQKQKGMVDTKQQQQIASTQLSSLNSKLIQAQTDRSEAEIRYKQAQNLKEGNESDHKSLESVLSRPSARAIVQEESRLSRYVQELSDRYGEKHPKLIAARTDLKEIKRNLRQELSKVVGTIQREYEAATAQERKISTLIKDQKYQIGSLKGANFELANLEREVENNRRIYESFLGRFQEADISEEYDATNIRIIDTANVPSTPYKPNKPRVIMISVVIGLFLGILLAFLRESLDNTFKTPGTIEEKLAIPALGLTSLVKNGRGDVIPEKQYLADSRSEFSENINHIRTGLLFSNIDHPPQVIMVTSSTASEGKSTLSINLAAALSQLGGRTLLLEADLRKPSIAKTMQINRTPGITDLIVSQGKIKQIPIQKIDGEDSNLYILTSGSLPPNPLELVSSDHFRKVLEKLKSSFKYIVIDTPPVLAVSDASVIGNLVDSTIIATKSESTTIKMAQEALGRLNKANIHVTGAVLTQAEPSRMNYYGGYYYHASYYGYKTPKTDKIT